jgi:hypothetical protein
LRKFIDSETVLGNGNKILALTQKYCIFLEKSYQNEAINLSKYLSSELSRDFNFSSKLMNKSKLLENYLLSYPNLLVSTYDSDPSNSGQNL